MAALTAAVRRRTAASRLGARRERDTLQPWRGVRHDLLDCGSVLGIWSTRRCSGMGLASTPSLLHFLRQPAPHRGSHMMPSKRVQDENASSPRIVRSQDARRLVYCRKLEKTSFPVFSCFLTPCTTRMSMSVPTVCAPNAAAATKAARSDEVKDELSRHGLHLFAIANASWASVLVGPRCSP